MADFQDSVGSKNNIFDSEELTLMHRWRYPSLSLHGIEGELRVWLLIPYFKAHFILLEQKQ